MIKDKFAWSSTTTESQLNNILMDKSLILGSWWFLEAHVVGISLQTDHVSVKSQDLQHSAIASTWLSLKSSSSTRINLCIIVRSNNIVRHEGSSENLPSHPTEYYYLSYDDCL